MSIYDLNQYYIGTSGWNYQHWKGIFYPEGLSVNSWLNYYCNFFNSVELNVTFYRLLDKKIFLNWYKRTPQGFYFVAKGWRYITHLKRLNNCKEYLELFFKRLLGLKDKLICVLWQFPSGFRKDFKRLEYFVKLLKRKKLKFAFEFRNPSWFEQDAINFFKENNLCLVIADSSYWPCVKEPTSNFLYIRFHGRNGLYSGNYSDKLLLDWADFILRQKKSAFVFFNNDASGYAVKNALRIKEFLTTSHQAIKS